MLLYTVKLKFNVSNAHWASTCYESKKVAIGFIIRIVRKPMRQQLYDLVQDFGYRHQFRFQRVCIEVWFDINQKFLKPGMSEDMSNIA